MFLRFYYWFQNIISKPFINRTGLLKKTYKKFKFILKNIKIAKNHFIHRLALEKVFFNFLAF
jgi:hypothetical protein